MNVNEEVMEYLSLSVSSLICVHLRSSAVKKLQMIPPDDQT
jgi:hypothetical protein